MTERNGRRRILVVEDDATIAGAVRSRLEAEGFAVHVVGDGEAAIAADRELVPDLIVLDRMLPGLDGLEVCRTVQAERPVPVLMLTALDDETDLLVGLGVGADDYMTKPFSPRELAARVHVLLRRVDRAGGLGPGDTRGSPASRASRASGGESARLRLGQVEVDQAERRVWAGGAEVHLTRTEYDLLLRLAERPGQVLERERLLADIWGYADAAAMRTVDSHIRALRRKLGADLIRTVHGVGYALAREDR
ncbi:MAG: response regulator [Streptosporangiales bacterium]|nr:response regulator [Streptosporangiales bacterium]